MLATECIFNILVGALHLCAYSSHLPLNIPLYIDPFWNDLYMLKEKQKIGK